MRVAVTADVHLSNEHPERAEHFEKLLGALSDEGVRELIVAGDLFDQGSSSIPTFDRLAERHGTLRFHVIRGNHDARLRAEQIAAGNVRVYDEPTALRIGNAPFVFLPYGGGGAGNAISMGEALEASGVVETLPAGRYVLVSHGDYGAVDAERSGGERGYFPLTQADIARYRPAVVLLGHIHTPSPGSITVRYPGSPYPLNVGETGPRRVLMLDTDTLRVSGRRLGHTPVYEQVTILMLPGPQDGDGVDAERNESADRLRAYLDELIGAEDPARLSKRLHLRVTVGGYARAREGIAETITGVCREYGVEEDRVMIRNDVAIGTGDERVAIAAEVRRQVEEISRREPEVDATRLLRRSLAYIFAEE